MIIDFHSHILPCIDDGSQSLQETQLLVEEEQNQGVQCIIATPHFYASQVSMQHFLERRNAAYEKTSAMLRESGSGGCLRESQEEYNRSSTLAENAEDRGGAGQSQLKILLGAEVYYFPGIGHAEEIERLCIEGTDLILVEMPFAQWTTQMIQDVQELISKKHLTVILAHIERYIQFQKDMKPWERLFELPIVAQMNAGPFVPGKLLDFSRNRQSRQSLQLCEKYAPVLLGTDCHNMRSRKPNLKAGYTVIREHLGEETVQKMQKHAETLLKDHRR